MRKDLKLPSLKTYRSHVKNQIREREATEAVEPAQKNVSETLIPYLQGCLSELIGEYLTSFETRLEQMENSYRQRVLERGAQVEEDLERYERLFRRIEILFRQQEEEKTSPFQDRDPTQEEVHTSKTKHEKKFGGVSKKKSK